MLASLIVFASAGAVVVTGFGFNLVSVPLLAFLYPPRTVVTVTLLLGVGVSGLLLARQDIRESVDWALVRPLFLWSLLGMPAGLALLLFARPAVLRMLIASLTAFVALLMLARFRPSFQARPAGTAATGVLSGFLSTSTGFNGAPIAFYLLGRGLSKDRFRGTSTVYVFLATLTSVGFLMASGSVTLRIVRLAATLLPSLLLGFGAGVAAAHRIGPQRFERVVLGFLIGVGILNLLGAAR
jgi:uncharacterized membrane protein YfcA